MTEIEELRAEVAALREELRALKITGVNHYHYHSAPPWPYPQPYSVPQIYPWQTTCGGSVEPIQPQLRLPNQWANRGSQSDLLGYPA